jgi:hypothetical protein
VYLRRHAHALRSCFSATIHDSGGNSRYWMDAAHCRPPRFGHDRRASCPRRTMLFFPATPDAYAAFTFRLVRHSPTHDQRDRGAWGCVAGALAAPILTSRPHSSRPSVAGHSRLRTELRARLTGEPDAHAQLREMYESPLSECLTKQGKGVGRNVDSGDQSGLSIWSAPCRTNGLGNLTCELLGDRSKCRARACYAQSLSYPQRVRVR